MQLLLLLKPCHNGAAACVGSGLGTALLFHEYAMYFQDAHSVWAILDCTAGSCVISDAMALTAIARSGAACYRDGLWVHLGN
jgi:hypothetical protein